MKQFFKKLAGFSVGPIVGAIFSCITVPVSTYLLMPNEYGKTSMFSLLYSILVLMTLFGFDQAYIREYHEHEDKRKLLFNAMFVPMVSALIVIPIIIPFAPEISFFLFESKEYVSVVYMLAAVLPLLVLERFILVDIRMQEKAFLYSLCSLFLKLIGFMLTLFFLLWIRRDFLAIIYSTLIAHYVGDAFLVLIYFGKLHIKRVMFDLKLLKRMTKFALPLLPATIIGMVFNGEDKVFIKEFSNYTELGYYQAAMSLASMVSVLQSAFSTFWTPTVLRWRSEGVQNSQYELVQKGVTLVSAGLFMGVLVFRNIFPIILSQKYQNAKYILPFLLFYPVMTVIVCTTESGMNFERKTQYTLYFSIIVTILNFILNFIFVPKWGSMGAAVATGVSHVFYFWIRTLYSRKLWFDFELKHLIITSIILLLAATVNSFSFIEDGIVYAVDFAAILMILVLYRDLLKKIIYYIKKRNSYNN